MAVRFCGFGAVRCLLVLLNSIYIGIALLIIGLVIAARTLAYNYTNLPVLIGMGIVAGFLFVVAVLGFVGTLRHNQIIMFFYMILLGLSGMALFAVSVAALAIPKQLQSNAFLKIWQGVDDESKAYLQDQLNCCGFNKNFKNLVECNDTPNSGHPFCNSSILLEGCCKTPVLNFTLPDGAEGCKMEEPLMCPKCDPCYDLWEESVSKGLKLAGGLGLVFSFTQIAGIVLTFRFRNLKDPTVNPVDFL